MSSTLFEPGAHDVMYVVDVSGYVFRAYHAIQPLTSPTGEPTHAVYGTINMLERLIRQCRPQLIGVAMDAGRDTFRKRLYPNYKAHRPPTPPDLGRQMQRVEELLEALGIPVFVQEGVEADDVIATLVAHARERELRVVVVSADKDLMPLVGKDVVLWDTMRDRVFGPEEVEGRFGVRVNQVRDWLALTGDSSDNVPGVPSVGGKTAQRLLAEYQTLDGVYENLARVKRDKLRTTLAEHRDQAYLSRDLVTLKSDCAIELDTEVMRRRQPSRERLERLYAELGFTRQLAALRAAEDGGDARNPPSEETRPPARSPEAPSLITDLAAVDRLIERARASRRLAVVPAVLTTDRGELLVGLGLSTGNEPCHYLPLAHRYVGAPQQLDPKAAWAPIARALEADAFRLGCDDGKQVLVCLARAFGASLPGAGVAFDAQLASYLIDPEGRRDLKTLSAQHLDFELASMETLTHPARGKRVPLDQLECEAAARVCGLEALAVARLWPKLERQLSEAGLCDLYRSLELPLSSLLAELELRGVRVDVARLSSMSRKLAGLLKELESEAHRIAGRDFNVNAPRQLETLLFDELGLKPLKRTKTARSTDAATLEALSDDHPLPAVVLEIRKLAKLKSTYVDALPALVRPDTGRIHTRWGQTTAATGRLASSDPNLQNIPIRSDVGREIRGAFVAPEGCQLVSADYSQIELRVLAHLSGDPVLLEAFRTGQDVHARTAMEIFEIGRDDVTAEHRRRAKAVNFGVIYGQGEHGLSQSLGIARGEARKFIKAYFERHVGVRTFMDETLALARENGSVKTLLGRRRLLTDINSKHHGRRSAAERVAMNTPIQGTAADLLKLAMLACRGPLTPGCRMILTVHDELVFEVANDEVESASAAIRQAMESVYPLVVPLVVDLDHGRAWDEAH